MVKFDESTSRKGARFVVDNRTDRGKAKSAKRKAAAKRKIKGKRAGKRRSQSRTKAIRSQISSRGGGVSSGKGVSGLRNSSLQALSRD